MNDQTQNELRAITCAGLAGGVAYLATMAVDLRLTGRNVDDLLFLGRPLVRDRRRARRLGLAVHAVNSLGLATVYARWGRARVTGPGWWRGILFATLENLTLYPLTALEHLHPGIREGDIDPYWTWPAFALSVPRHIAFGAALGAVYNHLRRFD